MYVYFSVIFFISCFFYHDLQTDLLERQKLFIINILLGAYPNKLAISVFIEAYKFTSNPLKIHDAKDKHYGKNIFTGKSSNYNDTNLFSLANIQI